RVGGSFRARLSPTAGRAARPPPERGGVAFAPRVPAFLAPPARGNPGLPRLGRPRDRLAPAAAHARRGLGGAGAVLVRPRLEPDGPRAHGEAPRAHAETDEPRVPRLGLLHGRGSLRHAGPGDARRPSRRRRGDSGGSVRARAARGPGIRQRARPRVGPSRRRGSRGAFPTPVRRRGAAASRVARARLLSRRDRARLRADRRTRRRAAHDFFCRTGAPVIRLRGFAGSAGHGRLVLCVFAALQLFSGAARAQSGQAEGLTVTSRVDRPAIWIADRLTYTVEIACPRGIDLITGDLGRDKLKLTGLEVVSTDTHRFDEANGVRYVFDYVLTTYRVDVATPTIGSFPVRYYLTRAGQRPEEAAPAGSVPVPPVSVPFRGLLLDDQAIYDVRDGRDVPSSRLPLRILGPVGFGLILLSIVPVVSLVAGFAWGLRERRRVATGSVRRSRRS